MDLGINLYETRVRACAPWHVYFLLYNVAYWHYVTYWWQDLQPIDRFVVEEYLLDVLLFLNGWFVDVTDSFVVTNIKIHLFI